MCTSTMAFQSSTRRSSKGDTGMIPALLIITSSLPWRSVASLTRRCTSFGWVTSALSAVASPPAA